MDLQTTLPVAIGRTWPGVRAKIVGGKIVTWDHPTIEEPSQTEINTAVSEAETYLLEKEQKKEDMKTAKEVLVNKHKEKKGTVITKADVDEYMKFKMIEELGLDLV